MTHADECPPEVSPVPGCHCLTCMAVIATRKGPEPRAASVPPPYSYKPPVEWLGQFRL